MNNLPMKSPAGRTPQKAYKHVKFMPLAHVRRVVDIRDNDGKQRTTRGLLKLALSSCRRLFVYFSNFPMNQRCRNGKLKCLCCFLFFSFIDCQNLFGIIYRCPREMKETLLMFRLVGEDINKSEWLQNLTTELANTTCTADTVRTGHQTSPTPPILD